MKSATTFLLVSLLITSKIMACDDYLKNYPSDKSVRAKRYARDCEIQDTYANLTASFKSHNINIEDIAEYKALRFIDRKSWDRAVIELKSPLNIYPPEPMTWKVWEFGINKIFPKNIPREQILANAKGFNKNTPGYENINFSKINELLLKNEMGNTSRDFLAIPQIHDSDSEPGTYRNVIGKSAAYPTENDDTLQSKLDLSDASIRSAQLAWEKDFGKVFKGKKKDYGSVFKNLVAQAGGLDPRGAAFGLHLTASLQINGSMAVTYARTSQVLPQMSWLETFINASLIKYQNNKSLMPPTEFAALVQKWFVMVHPFSDGNGRTSRAIQDLILASFKLPYAPAGDLQEDVVEDYDSYVDNTYSKIEFMLKTLKKCLSEVESAGPISFGCQTVEALNAQPATTTH